MKNGSSQVQHSPDLLQQSQSLRYQVYCVDRGFLDARSYPEELECDEFDPHALHFCETDSSRRVADTVRLILENERGFPLFLHCSALPEEHAALHAPGARIGEISRLAVRRDYGGRDGCKVVLQLYMQVYQAAKRLELTEVIAATEKPLVRLVGRYGFPLRKIGPEVQYGGRLRAPYAIRIADVDRTIASGEHALLNGFQSGLEQEKAAFTTE